MITSLVSLPQKIRDFGESIIVYPFYMEFSFLALVRVYLFLESVAVKAVRTFSLGTRLDFSMSRYDTHA